MFTKILATAATLLLAAGIALVAAVAPASAYTPSHAVDCSSLTVSGTGYDTVSGNATPNRATVVIDGSIVVDTWFGATLDPRTVTYDPSASHTWSISVDAVGGTGDTQYDWTASGVTTPCSYPSRSMEITCAAVSIDWGAALTNGVAIEMRVQTTAGEKALSAMVDLNVAGGYQGLGVRVTDLPPIPLTEQQVKSGHLDFDYPAVLAQGGFTAWAVKWVHFDGTIFNQDGSQPWIECDGAAPEDAAADIAITPATCAAGEELVLGSITNASWGEVVGAYSVVATADAGHRFPAGEGVAGDGSTKTFSGSLAPALDRNDPGCATAVTPEAPTLVLVTACDMSGSVTPVAVDGVDYQTDFDPMSGVYTVTATPTDGHIFAGDADQIITFSGDVGVYYPCQREPGVTLAADACQYSADGTAADRSVVLTFDNTASNTAVLFQVTSLSAYDRSVAAGATQTVTIEGIGAGGVDYVVTAAANSFDLTVPPCDEPVKPDPETREEVSQAADCGAGEIVTTSITYTTDFVFNTTTATWERGPETAGEPVVTRRAMTDGESVTACGPTEDPAVTFTTEACSYSSEGRAAPRTVVITYDNTASTGPLLFRLTSMSAHDRTVAARATESVVIAGIGAAGVDYEVTAGSSSFDLTVPVCAEPEKPVAQTRDEVVDEFRCASSDVQTTTVSFTTDSAFNPTTVAWEVQPEVESGRSTTTRPMEPGEVATHCSIAVDDPFVSDCAMTSPGDAPAAGWVRVDLDAGVIYTITNSKTDVTLTATEEYTSVPAGPYIVRAAAAAGYELSPTDPRVWTFIVDDTDDCSLPTEAIVVPAMAWTAPSCTSAGTVTLSELTPGTIAWSANGQPMPVGTYTVADDEMWVLQAEPADPNDAIDAQWVDPVALTFDASGADCAGIGTAALASTGTMTTPGLAAGALALLVAGAGLAAGRRMRERSMRRQRWASAATNASSAS